MPKIKIITDSTCDLPDDYYREYAIGVVPVNIQFGNESFEEGITIDRTTFFKKIDDLGIIPQTSQPSVGQFAKVYRACAEQGYDTIISVHITSKLSGTFNSALIASREVADEIRVIPYDSLAGTAAMGYMCVDAAQMVQAGKSVEEIITRLDAARPKLRLSFSLATLRYAQMSGRISYLQESIASLLHIKPIITLHEGALIPCGRAHSRQAAMGQILELTEKAAAGGRPVKFAALHVQAHDEAERLLELGKQQLNYTDAFVANVAISLAGHFGPGAIGMAIYPAE